MFALFKKSPKGLKLKISDDSGFLAIVNTDTYHSFVNEDWKLEELMDNIIHEMNMNNIIFWATGSSDEWTLLFTNEPSGKKAFREFSKTISVTNNNLYLTNYEDLTLCAQFEDKILPCEHNADLDIKIENGLHNITIRQMFDPEDYNYDPEGKVNFEVVIAKTEIQSHNIDNIYWLAE